MIKEEVEKRKEMGASTTVKPQKKFNEFIIYVLLWFAACYTIAILLAPAPPETNKWVWNTVLAIPCVIFTAIISAVRARIDRKIEEGTLVFVKSELSNSNTSATDMHLGLGINQEN